MEPDGTTQKVLEEIARRQIVNKEELVSFLQKEIDNPSEVVAAITKDLSSQGLITNLSPIGESYFAITQKGMRKVGK